MSGEPRVVHGFPAVMGNAKVGPRRRAPLPPRSFHRPCRGLCGAGTRWLHTRLVGQPAQGHELRTQIAGTIARNAPGRAAAVRGALGVARDAGARCGERREKAMSQMSHFVRREVNPSTRLPNVRNGRKIERSAFSQQNAPSTSAMVCAYSRPTTHAQSHHCAHSVLICIRAWRQRFCTFTSRVAVVFTAASGR